MIEKILSLIWRLHPHPLIVHFPIALFITALGMEILGLIFRKEYLHRCAYYNYFFGILATAAAILAAWLENHTLRHAVFYTHKNLAYWTFWIASSSGLILPLIKRKSKKAFRIIFFVFLIATASLVSLTGYYGGKLVYEYGIGVEEGEGHHH